jgi:hypothetical protein
MAIAPSLFDAVCLAIPLRRMGYAGAGAAGPLQVSGFHEKCVRGNRTDAPARQTK